MIAIIDNGGSYSDHWLYFVTVANEDEAKMVIWFYGLTNTWDDDCHIVALAESLDWRSDDGVTDVNFFTPTHICLACLRPDHDKGTCARCGGVLYSERCFRCPGTKLATVVMLDHATLRGDLDAWRKRWEKFKAEGK